MEAGAVVPPLPDPVTMRAGLILPLLALLSCKNDLDELASIEIDARSPDRITTQAEYYYSDSGHVRNRLRAGRVEEYLPQNDEHTDFFQGVELTFFDATGQPGSRLTAERGRMDPKRHRMQVDEHVVFTNVRGERLETEQLIWDQDSDRVFTDKPVRITRAQDIIYGQGLDANQDFSRYTIRRITGTIFVAENDSILP